MIYANAGKARIGGRDINVPCDPLKLPAEGGRERRVARAVCCGHKCPLRPPEAHLMIYVNTGKAPVNGRDINVPCDPLKLPAEGGRER